MLKELRIAEIIIKDWKKDDYIFGLGCLPLIGKLAKELGSEVLISVLEQEWVEPVLRIVENSLFKNSINIIKRVSGARPNAPVEDLYKLQDEIEHYKPDFVLSIGGGSSIDLAKAACFLAAFTPTLHNIEPFFGTDNITNFIRHSDKNPIPLLAVQTASSSAAHLTKYSNITDLMTGQKKLIVDTAIVPQKAIFDYTLSQSMGVDYTLDGALDGFASLVEVYLGAGDNNLSEIEKIALLGIKIIVDTLPAILNTNDLFNLKHREKLGLATDLSGYSIMIGGTSGPHLNSFSLVDVTSHGRACAILNPYYIVFFAPQVERQLRQLGIIFKDFIDNDLSTCKGRDLGIAVAKGIMNFYKLIKFPTSLKELNNFSDIYIDKALSAAKNPQLEMKLKNMPVPLNINNVEYYMKKVLMAAKTGDLDLIENLE